MPQSPCPILIVSSDLIHATFLKALAEAADVGSSSKVAYSAFDAFREIDSVLHGVVIVDADGFDGDPIDLIEKYQVQSRGCGRSVVLTRQRQIGSLKRLLELEIKGAFDTSTEGTDLLIAALRAIASGGVYWSKTLRDFVHRENTIAAARKVRLTASERRVLSVIGDGSDNETASTVLGLSPETISSLRREIHRKLGVRHRGELVRAAILGGYVRIASNIRSGLPVAR